MTDPHVTMRERVLALEDLEGPDRETTLAHLQTCADCRSLREALLAREALARPAGSLPPPSRWDALALDDLSRAGERRSLAALLERGTSRGGVRPARRPARGWLLPATAAAAAAVIVAVLLVRPPSHAPVDAPPPAAPLLAAPEPPSPAALRVEPGPGARGRDARGDAAWRTGDAFRLRFELAEPAPVVVVHAGPDGAVSLLVPDSATAPAPRLGPGTVDLPTEASGMRWTFEGPPGTESFVVASFVRTPDVRAIAAALPPGAAADRAGRLRDVVAALERAGGRVERVDVTHQR